MRLHFSSASTLALATAATLGWPLSLASAEDFVIRDGQKIAASLEMPVKAAAPQALAANPHVQVNNGETITNNEDLISGTVNNGRLINNGKITYFDVFKDGSADNNQNGDVGRMRIFGKAANNGKIYSAHNNGAFINGSDGKLTNLRQLGGEASNTGTIVDADVRKGTLNNRSAGSINTAVVSARVFNNGTYDETAATLNNSGRIETVDVSKLGTLNNYEGGSLDKLTNAGTAFNEGQIGTITQTAGNLTNNGIVLGKTTLAGGILTNNKSMGTLETTAGTTFLNAENAQLGALTNFGISANNGIIGGVFQKGGTFSNGESGTIQALMQDDGVSTNDGKITSIATISAGTLTNNASGAIARSTVSGGALLNSGKITDVTVLERGSFTNNQTGMLEQLHNYGSASNAGQIAAVDTRGIFANSASGKIDELSHIAGTTTNDGTIKLTIVQAGTLTNNGTGVLDGVALKGGALLNNGQIEDLSVDALSTLTNNLSGTVARLKNSGTVTNAGQIGTIAQTAGALTNSGSVLGEALIEGGALTNNKALGTVVIAGGAAFVNNKGGIARALTNSGTASNDGSIRYVEQKAGTLVNEAEGTIEGLIQTGGATTNNNMIARANIEGGSIANNENGKLSEVNLTGGSLQNSGMMTNLSVGEKGKFANNATGQVERVSSQGEGVNDGKIVKLAVTAGQFKNSGVVAEDVSVSGGRLISTGTIGGKLTIDGTAAAMAIADLSGNANGGVQNGTNGGVNLRGDLTGRGNFVNNGQMLSNASHAISGFDAFVNAGSLFIRGDLDVSGDVVSSGKISMAGDFQQFDSLKAGGKLTLTSTSETAINLNSDGDHDTLSAGGDLTLGGALNIRATGNGYGLKSTFEAFSSTAGKVAGQFTDVVVTGTKDLFGAAEKTASGMVLAIRNRALLNKQLEDLELGENQEVLTGLNYGGTDGARLFDTIAAIKADEAPGIIAQITGAASSAAVNVGNNAAQGFGNLMQKVATASGLRRSNDGVLAYEKARKAGEDKFEPVLRNGQGAVGFWARGFGETGTGASSQSTIGGVGAGAEIAMGEKLTVGASAGYSMARFGQGNSITGNTNSFHGGGYIAVGATAPESTGFGLTASGSYSLHETNQERTIKIGSLTSIAKANYGGTTIAGEVMARSGFTIGDTVPLTIAPVAGVKFAMDNDEGYTETGAGGLNLTVSDARRRSLVGVVGLQLASRIETESVVFIPHGTAVYQHEFLDTSSSTTRTLSGSATPFTVKQDGGARSSVALEAGLGMRFAGGLAVDISGYGVVSSDEKRYGATATLKAGF